MSETPLRKPDQPPEAPGLSAGSEVRDESSLAGPAGIFPRPDPVRLLPGNRIFSGFTLVERISLNENGEVWKATRPDNALVMLLCIDSWRSGANAELRALSRMLPIRQPHILSLFGPWQSDGWIGVGADLPDETLLDQFESARNAGHPGIEIGALLDFMDQAAQGIDYLTEPRHALPGESPGALIHGDIQPSHLLVIQSALKIARFTQVQRFEVDPPARFQNLAPHAGLLVNAYSAPEIYRGKISLRSDQYSLAATYCHLRAGQIPLIPTDRLESINLSMLPHRERFTVDRALSLDPDRRWPSCGEFIAALRDVTRPVVAIPTRNLNALARPEAPDPPLVPTYRGAILAEINHDFIDDAALEPALPSLPPAAPPVLTEPVVVVIPPAVEPAPPAAPPVMAAANPPHPVVVVEATPAPVRPRWHWLVPSAGLAAGVLALLVCWGTGGMLPGASDSSPRSTARATKDARPDIAPTQVAAQPARKTANSSLPQAPSATRAGATSRITPEPAPSGPATIPLVRVELPRAPRRFAALPAETTPPPTLATREPTAKLTPTLPKAAVTPAEDSPPRIVANSSPASVAIPGARSSAPAAPAPAAPATTATPPRIVLTTPPPAEVRATPGPAVVPVPSTAPVPVSRLPEPVVVARTAPLTPTATPGPPLRSEAEVPTRTAAKPVPLTPVVPPPVLVLSRPADRPTGAPSAGPAASPAPSRPTPVALAEATTRASLGRTGPTPVVVPPPILTVNDAPTTRIALKPAEVVANPAPPSVVTPVRVAAPPGPSGAEVAAALASWADSTADRLRTRASQSISVGQTLARAVVDRAAAMPGPRPSGPTGPEIVAAVQLWASTAVGQWQTQVRSTWVAGRTWLRAHPLPTPPALVAPAPPALTTPRTITIVVRMPSPRAELVVRGAVGRGNPDEWYGPTRVIHSPPLTEAMDYLVGAFWMDATGQPATRSQALRVEPGHRYEVDLRTDKTTAVEVPRSVGP